MEQGLEQRWAAKKPLRVLSGGCSSILKENSSLESWCSPVAGAGLSLYLAGAPGAAPGRCLNLTTNSQETKKSDIPK